MEKSYKLLILSKPKPDENLFGYILRLAELNYCESPAWLIKACGLDSNYYGCIGTSLLVGKSKELSALSRLIDIDALELLSLACQPVKAESHSNENLFFGFPLPRYLIRSLHPKVCPSCLKESNYYRNIWDLAPITVCPMHKALLLDKCPGCSKFIKWERKKVSICVCGCDWRNHDCESVKDADLKVTLQIYRICKLIDRETTSFRTRDENPLLTLDLGHFISALFFIAGQYDGASNKMGALIPPRMHNLQLHSLVCRAFPVFEDWPNQFYLFLDWLRDKNNVAGEKYGVVGDFGGFFYRRMMAPEFSFIKEAFNEYLCTRWDGGHLSRLTSLSDDIRKNKKYVSRFEARDLLKVDFCEVDRLIQQKQLKATIKRQGKYRAFLIDLSDIKRVRRELDETLNIDDVIELLDVGLDQVLDLIAHKCLEPFRGPSIDGYSIWKFKREEVNKLIAELINRISKLTSSFHDEFLDYKATLYQLRFCGISAGKFFQAVLHEHIQPCGDNGKNGLPRFLFSTTQISNYRRKLWLAKKGKYLFGSEVAEVLGLKRFALSFLVKKGLISAERKPSWKAHYKISKEALESFYAEYTILPEKIARDKRTCSRSLVNALFSRGVQPVSGPKVDGGLKYVFRRTDLEDIDIAALAAEIKSDLKFCYDLSHLLDSAQAANILGVDAKTITIMIKNGVLKPYSTQVQIRDLEHEHKFTPEMVKKFKGKNLNLTDLISAAEAAKILGGNRDHFSSVWVNTKMIMPLMRDGRVGKRYFSLREVKQLAEYNANVIGTAEAGKILDISRLKIVKMTNTGQLRSVSRLANDGLKTHYKYLRSDIEKYKTSGKISTGKRELIVSFRERRHMQ